RLWQLLKHPDFQALTFVLAFFSVVYRSAIWQGRHWLFADNSFQNFPWHYWVFTHARQGGLTDPCQAMSLGFPLYAEPQAQCFYPFNTAWWPIGDPFVSFTVKMLLHMLAATIGMYVLARQERRSPLAAAGAAVVMCGSSYMVHRVMHAPILFGLAWLPWIVLLYLRALRTGSRTAFVGMTLCAAMQILAGHPQPVPYTVLICLILGLFSASAADGATAGAVRRRALGLIAGAWGLALVIAMVQLAPTYELYLYGAREAGDVGLVRQWGATLREVAVDFLGGLPIAVKAEKTAFIGTVAWVAVLYALWRVRDRRMRGWLTIALIGLVLSWVQGNPLYAVVAHVPVFDLLRAPSRIGLLLMFGAAMLVADFLDRAREGQRQPLLAAAAGVLVLLELVALGATGKLGLGPIGPTDPLGWQLVTLIGCAAAVALAFRRGSPARWFGPIVVLLMCAELSHFSEGVNPSYTKQQWLAQPGQRIYEVAARCTQADGTAFTRWQDGLPDNVAIYYGVPQPRSFTPAASPLTETVSTWFYGPDSQEMLSAFGVGWVAGPLEWGRNVGLEFVDTVGPWHLFRNPLPAPHAYMPELITPGSADRAALMITSYGVDPRRQIVLPSEIMGEQPVVCPNAQVTVASETDTRLVVRTRTTTPGVVVVTRLWAPQWEATMDGQPTECISANSVLLAAAVPPGEHTVQFDWVPNVRAPGIVSLLGVLGCLIWLVAEIRRHRRRRPSPPLDAEPLPPADCSS
ncbi:MAG: YfhO family protein, partial [Armatimonadetes bacterium]|nr:YfhO family protein [Armatimonadota bacterium]